MTLSGPLRSLRAWRAALAAVAVTAASVAVSDEAPNADKHNPAPIIITGFDRPESVLHDVERDIYLVSNITNGPRDTDNTGFISRVAPNGRVLALKWIEGGVNGVTLNAPKGSTIANGVLYVADIDQIRKFDARTGAARGNVAVPSATFLNDVTSDHHGNVYVTDIGFTTVPVFGPSGTDAIWKLTPKGKLSTVATGNSLLNHPTGIAARRNGDLLVVTYDPFNNTKELFTIDKRGHKTVVATLPTGLLDGVVVIDEGILVSSWVDFSNATAGVIYLVRHDGSVVEVARGFQNPSDIGFDAKRNRILIPELPDPGAGGRVTLQTLRSR